MNNVLESCVKAMDNDLQNEINLDQTDAYYEMINTIASKALQIRENLNKQQKYSLDDIPTYKDKIWKIWREHFLSYMSVLMNF